MRIVCLTVFILFLPYYLIAQDMESLEVSDFSNSNSNSEYSLDLIMEIVDYYYNRPVNLAVDKAALLAELPGFDYFSANDIINIARSDTIFSMQDIFQKYHLTYLQKYILINCTVLNKNEKAHDDFVNLNINSNYRFQKEKGFENGKYLGNDMNQNTRFSAGWGNFIIKSNINKNAGEIHTVENSSFSINYSDVSYQFILGDFKIAAGIGNLFGSGTFGGKSVASHSKLSSIKSDFSSIASKLSFSVLRGVSLLFDGFGSNSNKFKFRLWASSSNRDASIDSLGNVTSIYRDSKYRTQTEINKKNNLVEKSTGIMALIDCPNFNIGFLSSYFNYSRKIISMSANSFNGQNGFLNTVFASYYLPNMIIAAETAFDNKFNPALIITASQNKRDYYFTSSVRCYSSEFHSPYSNGFSEQSNSSNEYGIYSGLILKISKTLQISLYTDFYKSIKRMYQLPIPVRGIEFYLGNEYNILKNMVIRLSADYENKTDTYTDEENSQLKYTGDRSDYLIKADIEWTANKAINLNVKLNQTYVRFENDRYFEKGTMVSLGAVIKIISNCRSAIEFTWFSTDSYNSSLWKFNYSMPGVWSLPALFGKGLRINLSQRLELTKNANIYAAFTGAFKSGTDVTGSGNAEIKGGNDTRVYIQFDLKM